jgi:threonine aldolase
LLEKDHERAKKFAQFTNELPYFEVDPNKVFTNIVLFDCVDKSVDDVLKVLRENGIGMVPFGPKTIRAVFHHQVNDDDLNKVIQVMDRLFKS